MERRPETAVRQLLRVVHDKHGGRPLVATDLMSDGSPICLKITVDYDKGEADFDFTGTGMSQASNLSVTKRLADICVKPGLIFLNMWPRLP